MTKTIYVAGMPEAQKDNRARMDELGNVLRENGYGVTGRPLEKEPWQMTREEYVYGENQLSRFTKEKWKEQFGSIPYPSLGKIKIYRGAFLKERMHLLPGDWVTLDKKFARENYAGISGTVLEKEVPLSELMINIGTSQPGKSELIWKPETSLEAVDSRGNYILLVEKHRQIVKQAAEQGKDVPADVLKDYPDLIKKEVQILKEPWQMTREEYLKTAVPLPDRKDYLKAWLRDNEDIPDFVKPGMNFIPLRGYASVVYGSERGQAAGVVTFARDAVQHIAVSDRYKGKGIATDLLEEARKHGARRVAGPVSPEFAGTAHKFMVRMAFLEGKPVPQYVLREYPDLMAKAQKQKWRGGRG